MLNTDSLIEAYHLSHISIKSRTILSNLVIALVVKCVFMNQRNYRFLIGYSCSAASAIQIKSPV